MAESSRSQSQGPELKSERIVILVAALASGCATTPEVAETDEVVSTTLSKCSDYDLTQDCSYWSGAKRKIRIDEFEVRIAGSTAGDFILIMDANLAENVLSDDIRLRIGKDKHSTYVNESYRVVEKRLGEHGISIVKTIRLGKVSEIDGYIIELDGDGYSVLIESAND